MLGIILTVMAFALPVATTSVRTARLTSAGSDYASLLQTARLRAVNDDRYYSVYLHAAQGSNPQMAYVDIYPQNANGTSGSGSPTTGGAYTVGPPSDPMVSLSSEITPQPQASAPNPVGLNAPIPIAISDDSRLRIKPPPNEIQTTKSGNINAR